MVLPGNCACCWKFSPELHRWKLRIWIDKWEWDLESQMEIVWICQDCINSLTREELAVQVRWTYVNIDLCSDLYFEYWQGRGQPPTPKPRLRVVSDGE